MKHGTSTMQVLPAVAAAAGIRVGALILADNGRRRGRDGVFPRVAGERTAGHQHASRRRHWSSGAVRRAERSAAGRRRRGYGRLPSYGLCQQLPEPGCGWLDIGGGVERPSMPTLRYQAKPDVTPMTRSLQDHLNPTAGRWFRNTAELSREWTTPVLPAKAEKRTTDSAQTLAITTVMHCRTLSAACCFSPWSAPSSAEDERSSLCRES